MRPSVRPPRRVRYRDSASNRCSAAATAACTRRWRAGASTGSSCASSLSPLRRQGWPMVFAVGRLQPGTAAMPRQAPNAAFTTRPRSTPPASRSWRAGPYQWVTQLGLGTGQLDSPARRRARQAVHGRRTTATDRPSAASCRPAPMRRWRSRCFVFDRRLRPDRSHPRLGDTRAQVLVRIRSDRVFPP